MNTYIYKVSDSLFFLTSFRIIWFNILVYCNDVYWNNCKIYFCLILKERKTKKDANNNAKILSISVYVIL